MATRRSTVATLLSCALSANIGSAVSEPMGVTKVFHRPPAAQPLQPSEAQEKLAELAQVRQRERDAAPRRLAQQTLDSAYVNAWKHDPEDPVQQVNVAPGAAGEAVVTWVSFKRGLPSVVHYAPEGGYLYREASGQAKVYTTQICLPNSVVMKDPLVGPPNEGFDFDLLAARLNTSTFLPKSSDSWKYVPRDKDPWEVVAQTNFCIDYKNPLAYYTSPYIHTVVLAGLTGRTRYTFRIASGNRTFTFQTPATAGDLVDSPFRLGVWADIGVTNVSFSVMKEMLALQPELLLTVGDLAYADGWAERWDAYGIMMEPLFSSRFQLAVPGNHELVQNNGIDFMSRFPMPFSQSGSESPFMFSYEAGPVHVLGLPGSYAETHRTSPQWNFAAEDLERVDRVRTPWVVVMFHTPWYNSNSVHYEEGLKHQWDMEELLYQHGVDLVFNGHVHSYERSFPVFNYSRDPCGITHIVIGDGGNYEGPAVYEGSPPGWRTPQPAWSAFREASFGGGLLSVINATHAEWEWRRVACVAANRNASETPARKYSYEGTRQSLGRTRPTTKYLWDGLSGPADGPQCATEGDSSEQRYVAVDKVTILRDVLRCPRKAAAARKAQAADSVPPAHASPAQLGGLTERGRHLVGATLQVVALTAAVLITVCGCRRGGRLPRCHLSAALLRESA